MTGVQTCALPICQLSKGTIVAAGDGNRDIYGNIHPLAVTVGDLVYFNDSHLTEITDDDNNKYYFISSTNLYGKVENA